jgi:hypothetical protein
MSRALRSRYAKDGWAIAADPHTPVGHLAALTAEAACVPFLAFNRVAPAGGPVVVPSAAGPQVRELS